MTTFKRSNRIYATAIRIDPDPCWFPSTGGRIDLPPPLVAERGERVDLAARLELADRRDEIRPREGRHPENPDEFARLLDGVIRHHRGSPVAGVSPADGFALEYLNSERAASSAPLGTSSPRIARRRTSLRSHC